MSGDQIEQIVVEMRKLAANIANAHISGFGNAVADLADRLAELSQPQAASSTQAGDVAAIVEEMRLYADDDPYAGKLHRMTHHWADRLAALPQPQAADDGKWVRVGMSAFEDPFEAWDRRVRSALMRFEEVSSDVGNTDLPRKWLDALVTLGLLDHCGRGRWATNHKGVALLKTTTLLREGIYHQETTDLLLHAASRMKRERPMTDTVEAITAEMHELAQTFPRGTTANGGLAIASLCTDIAKWADRLAALFQPQAASSTQAVPVVQSTAPERIWLTVSDEPIDAEASFPGSDDWEHVCWSADAPIEVCVPYVRADLASSTTPGSTGAVDALPAKWRAEAATLRRLAGKAARRGDLADSEIRLGHAQDAEAYADELEAALAQPAQQGERGAGNG